MKVRTVLAAAGLVSSLWVVAPDSAPACDRQPCQGRCDVNPPAEVQDDGSVVLGGQGDLIECYY